MAIRLLLTQFLQSTDCVRLGDIYESVDMTGDPKDRRDTFSNCLRVTSFQFDLSERKLFRR